jgi:hypothetical protein
MDECDEETTIAKEAPSSFLVAQLVNQEGEVTGLALDPHRNCQIHEAPLTMCSSSNWIIQDSYAGQPQT